jgi:putative ABC transport system permease protein
MSDVALRAAGGAGRPMLAADGAGRVRSWLSGWRLALRMARRDIRRDRGRSLFVWLMIAVPVALIAASQVLLASTEVSAAEWTGLRLGTAQARLTWVGHRFQPGVDGMNQVTSGGDGTGDPRPVPGWGDTIAARESAVSRLVGQPAVAITTTQAEFGSTAQTVTLLGLAAARPAAAPIVRLTAGRLPAAAGEALVTAAGLHSGLPASGTVTVHRGNRDDLRLTVVGTAEVRQEIVVDLVTAPAADADELGFLVTGAAPVTWADAQRLAGYGFETTSRDLVAHPPDGATPLSDQRLYYGGLAGAGGLLEVALLVGPAFAIGAARQRRSLALAATNGATVRQLRRSALGQAVLLGSTATVAGMLLGTGAGVAVWPALSSDPTEIYGPLEVPWPFLACLLVLGTLTALTAALVTARGLGRLDLVAALRGSVRSAEKPRRGAPAAGVLLVAAGLSGAWLAGALGQAGVWFAFGVWLGGAVLAVAGVLLATPGLLRLLARLVSGAPVVVRMAVRDLARQRGRATATVASVVGGALLLGTAWTMLLSIEADEARMYIPRAPDGQGTVGTRDGTPAGLDGIDAAVHSAGLYRTFRLSSVGGWAASADSDPLTIAALRPGCTTADVMADDVPERCRSLSADVGSGILVGSVADLTSLFGLDPGQADVLAQGGLLVNTEPVRTRFGTPVNDLVDGKLRLAYLDMAAGPEAKQRTVSVPATAVTTALLARGAAPQRTSVLAATGTAARLHWVTQDWGVRVVDPEGPILEPAAARIDAALDDPWLSVRVERGFVPTPQPVMWLITGTLALLAVIGAAMSTILATAELRPFLATFAAVGASPRLSRRVAATQAAVLALVATVLGFALGLAAGAPLALSVTDQGGTATSLVVLPWLVVGGFVVAVPLVAAAVAALSTPARPVLASRTT